MAPVRLGAQPQNGIRLGTHATGCRDVRPCSRWEPIEPGAVRLSPPFEKFKVRITVVTSKRSLDRYRPPRAAYLESRLNNSALHSSSGIVKL